MLNSLIWFAAFMAVVPNILVVGAILVARWRPRPPAEPARGGPDVALLVPFRGLDDDAEQSYRTFLAQRYPARRVVFVTESDDDPGIAAVRAAIAGEPRAALMFTSPADQGLCGKVRNMVAGWRATDAPFVAIIDSDVALDPDDVGRCMALFDDPKVGAAYMPAVFEAEGLAGRLASLVGIDGIAMTSAASRLGVLRFMQGGLMVVRRGAIEASGGIEGLSDTISDDLRLANMVRAAGYSLRATDRPLVHPSRPESVASWASRYHRWMISERGEFPLAFFALVALNATVWPLLAALAQIRMQTLDLALAIALLGLGLRLLSTTLVDHAILRRHGLCLGGWTFLRPLGDIVTFLFCVFAVIYPRVTWRGYHYTINWKGTIASADHGEVQPES